MAVALTLTLIFRVEVGRCVWLACLAVEAGCGFIGEHVDYFCDCWCVSDGEGRKIENMVSRMR